MYFLNMLLFFKTYTTYTEAYNEVIEMVKEEKVRDNIFAAELEKGMKHPLAKGLELGAFLILPVQRIPRYVLLLTDLLRNTPEEHVDYQAISSALNIMKVVADHIDEAIAGAENRNKCLKIQQLFQLLPTQQIKILAPNRRYIYDGILLKQCRKDRKERRFFLFTDALLYSFETVPGTGKYTLSGQMSLLNLAVDDVPDKEEQQIKNALLIQSSGKSFIVYAESQEEKKKWYTMLTDAIREEKDRQKTLKVERVGEEIAPVWTPDNEVYSCTKCNCEFNLFRRKHHCRSCGKIFCGKCSSNMMVVSVSKEPERLCDACFQNRKQLQRINTSNTNK